MPLEAYVRRLYRDERRRRRLTAEFEREGLRRPAREALELIEAGRGYSEYQPLYGLADDPAAPDWQTTRNTDERWAMMESHLPTKGSALDVGSQHGWFTFKLAERGLFAIGVDRSERSVRVSQALSLYHGAGRTAFMKARFDPKTARQLPTVDVVLCLSVFHHLVRKRSLEWAESSMKALAGRCRQQLFFETGQSDDTNHKWAEQLAFMGDSPKQWITDFLLSLGFSEVIHIGDSLGHRHESPRHLLLAKK